MIRKVQESRRLNYINLPSDWVKCNNIGKGSELLLETDGCELKIKPNTAFKKKIELKVEYNEVYSLGQLVRICFNSGATDINIKLIKPLNPLQIKELKTILKNQYGLQIMEITSNYIKTSINLNSEDFNQTSHMIFNSAINTIRAFLADDKEMVDTHSEQTQFFRHLIKRYVNISKKNLSWSIICERLGLISRIAVQEFGKKGVTVIVFEKILHYMQQLIKPDLSVDEFLKILKKAETIKNLIKLNDDNRLYNLDRAYFSLVQIIRELLEEKIKNDY